MVEMGARREEEEEPWPWEERTLSPLHGSHIDRALSAEAVAGNRLETKKHKMKHLRRRPLALPEAILEFLNEDLRENAIRYVSNFLLEKREEDPDNYYRAGYLVFYSCSTMCILLQELVAFFGKMIYETLSIRSIKRLANVLTLFQSVAANDETRQKFVDACVPNFLIPLILFKNSVEEYDNIRAIALSVIGILCQSGEPKIIEWAIESDIIELCRTTIEIGSELTAVVAMHIMEAILKDKFGLCYICSSDCLLKGLINTWNHLVNLLAADQDSSPRLLFHVLRCYNILCTHERGYKRIIKSLPHAIKNNSFDNLSKEFPIIRNLIHQLLLNVGEVTKDTAFRKFHFHSGGEERSLHM